MLQACTIDGVARCRSLLVDSVHDSVHEDEAGNGCSTIRDVRLFHVATATAAALVVAGSTVLNSHVVPGDVERELSVAFESRVEVRVDPRFELFSVLERLAGAPEYGVAATPYARAADVWFAPHAADAAVVTMRRLRAENGIGYDAALTLAAQLDEQLRPVRPLSPLPEGVDQRWEGVDIAALLDEVRAFATDTRFDEFIVGETEYTSNVEAAFRSFVAGRPLVSWFDDHLGARDDADYSVVPGLLTGLMSYGIHAGVDEIFAVVALEAPDADGLPTLGPLSEEMLVHELAHSYVNPVVHDHLAEFSEPSPVLVEAAPAMAQQHYPTLEIVIDESIVRALTVLYLYDEVDTTAANAVLARQVELGFSWVPALARALDSSRSAHGGTWSDAELIATTAAVLGLDE